MLSAMVFTGGRLVELHRGWQHGAFTPLVSHDAAAELVRVSGYPKFRLTAEEQEVLLADYLPHADTVRIPVSKHRVPECRDPFDVPFVLFAVDGKDDLLVTGDQDLLSLNGQIPCPIVTAEVFLQSLPPAGE